MIDHAVESSVAHATSSQRMRRDQVFENRPGRRDDRVSAGGRRELQMGCDNGFNHLARLSDVPHHCERGLAGQELVVQAENSVGGVHALGEPGHNVVKGLIIVIAEHMAEGVNQHLRVESARVLTCLQRPHVVCKQVRKAAIFNPK